jgi:hypothetical protein
LFEYKDKIHTTGSELKLDLTAQYMSIRECRALIYLTLMMVVILTMPSPDCEYKSLDISVERSTPFIKEAVHCEWHVLV